MDKTDGETGHVGDVSMEAEERAILRRRSEAICSDRLSVSATTSPLWLRSIAWKLE